MQFDNNFDPIAALTKLLNDGAESDWLRHDNDVQIRWIVCGLSDTGRAEAIDTYYLSDERVATLDKLHEIFMEFGEVSTVELPKVKTETPPPPAVPKAPVASPIKPPPPGVSAIVATQSTQTAVDEIQQSMRRMSLVVDNIQSSMIRLSYEIEAMKKKDGGR